MSLNVSRNSMYREGKLTWHDGTIPDDEIWLKLDGDKGDGYFKMNFQIVNTPAPNSVRKTFVANICTMKWK